MKKIGWLASVAAVLVSASAFGAPAGGEESYVISIQGERVAAKSISAAADGSITYQTQSGTSITWNARQYKTAYVPKPPEVAAMEAAVAQKRYDEVLAQAGKAALKNYQFLGWGGLVALLEGNAQAARENYAGAVACYDRGMLQAAKDGLYEGEL